jgi:uncharacterized membrane protein YgaE (UPF0421/DUF939 family)
VIQQSSYSRPILICKKITAMVFDRLSQLIIAKENPSTLKNALRTAVAAIVSLLVAHVLGLPETYWAAVSTLIVMQSSLGAALPVSVQRFTGTLVGAIVGGLIGTHFPQNIAAFGVAVFAIGILCVPLKVDRSAFRYANITLAIIVLVPRATNEWVVALHRFCEVSIGILVGLALSAVWPEQESETTGKKIEVLEHPIDTG